MAPEKTIAKAHRASNRIIQFFLVWLYFSAVLPVFCAAAGELDKSRYIDIDEIHPGMKAYCRTVYEGGKIEQFDLKVLSVVRDIRPGRDAILVQGTGKRFIHTGPVAGCSGSPVYIDGRLAGALAFGWLFSKDPLYGVTPIAEMLQAGLGGSGGETANSVGLAFDFSRPLDFAEIDKQISNSLSARNHDAAGASPLPSPLVMSGLPPEVCEQLGEQFESFGLMAVSGIGGKADVAIDIEQARMTPGACLAVPLVTGDMTMDVIGTVTEVVDDKVYGFGHSFLGYGPTDLPMATGTVHTVVSNVQRSFKLGTANTIVGALRSDESAAVMGLIGAKASMIPISIGIDRFNDTQKRSYKCQIVDNRLLTAPLVRATISGAVYMLGSLPPDHMLNYKINIEMAGGESIGFENISTGAGTIDVVRESMGAVALLMNNPYKRVGIKSIEADVRITAKNISSHIWSVDLADSKVKAGKDVKFGVVVESVLSQKKQYQGRLRIPKNLPPGRYDLIICGGYAYQEFLRKATPYRYTPENLSTLIEAINNILAVRRDKLYCLLVLPPGGVALERAELPDLPATKVLVLADPKRTLRILPYQQWVEQNFDIDTIVSGKKVMRIIVEE